MTEPTTLNRALIVPNTGDLLDHWGDQALNPDFVSIDAMFGGVATVSLSNSPVVLTVPSGFSATPTTGPTQSQNAIIRFTGTLTGNCQITFPMPGIYVAENLTTGAFVVTLFTGVGGGKVIALPPGEAVDVYNDGTDFKFRNIGRIGGYLDIGTSSIPAWITSCTVPPYLNCDGSSFSAVTYPVLSSLLGGTTLPDLRGRTRAALNQTTGRITTAGSGIDGNTILSAGGSQTHTLTTAEIPSHSHGVTEPTVGSNTGHVHGTDIGAGINFQTTGGSGGAGGTGAGLRATANTGYATTGITINTTGGGTAHAIMNPIAIAGLTLIRAG